ncbi:DUF6612 family protein [Anaerotignum sp. MB30-C6]|uniref:DUF6612 family protein n=1 Tax=Anaerotignum sp. MB30-C6 TaxID=3070814 RepID=UPI0027DC4DA0|nr:DUF6612 family protein [Anaerotignum sp. MB30-C6]WMI80480.1 hypothetical protein RBQ60_11670 [Anaerotignum sp. MB30-C6]
MKIRLSYLALMIMAVMAFTGCTNGEKSASELVESARVKMGEVTSLQAKMDMNVKMKLSEEEVTTVTTADITAFVKPLKMKLDVSSSMMNGGPQDTVMQMYVKEDENGVTSYANTGTGWFNSKIERDSLGQYHVYENIVQYLTTIEEPVDKGTEKIGDIPTVQVEGILKGDAMEKIVIESGILTSAQSVGISEEELKDMYAQVGGLPITLWISQDGLVYQYKMDMTKLMQMVMDKTMELIGVNQLDTDMNIQVEDASIGMKCDSFNEVDPFEIPEDVLLVGQE